MSEEKISRIKESDTIKGIKFSICSTVTGFIYDIIGEGDVKDLEQLRESLDIESNIIEKSIFDTPLIVIDTTFDIDDAKYTMKKIIKRWSEIE